jgi:hypothetical protein
MIAAFFFLTGLTGFSGSGYSFAIAHRYCSGAGESTRITHALLSLLILQRAVPLVICIASARRSLSMLWAIPESLLV